MRLQPKKFSATVGLNDFPSRPIRLDIGPLAFGLDVDEARELALALADAIETAKNQPRAAKAPATA